MGDDNESQPAEDQGAVEVTTTVHPLTEAEEAEQGDQEPEGDGDDEAEKSAAPREIDL